MARRRIRYAIVVLGVLMAGGLGAFVCRPNDERALDPLPLEKVARRRYVRDLLERALVDDDHWKRRITGGGSHIGQFMSTESWYGRYPVKYAAEHLLSQGSDALDDVVEVFLNPREKIALRSVAGSVLTNFDDPRTLQAYQESSTAGLPDYLLTSLLRRHFAGLAIVHSETRRRIPTQEMYTAVALEIMDRLLDPNIGPQSSLYSGDHRVLRWLNRMYDQDLDEWLAKVAPHALRFRLTQLKKGYDRMALP